MRSTSSTSTTLVSNAFQNSSIATQAFRYFVTSSTKAGSVLRELNNRVVLEQELRAFGTYRLAPSSLMTPMRSRSLSRLEPTDTEPDEIDVVVLRHLIGDGLQDFVGLSPGDARPGAPESVQNPIPPTISVPPNAVSTVEGCRCCWLPLTHRLRPPAGLMGQAVLASGWIALFKNGRRANSGVPAGLTSTPPT
jgi:hypothetical protein